MPLLSGAFCRDVAIVGGCGRVGLPLGIAFADRGLAVTLCDINAGAVDQVNAGQLPFREDGAEEPLAGAVRDGRLVATTDPACVGTAPHVIVVIGTPVDEHLNPDLAAVPRAIESCAGHLVDGQLIVLRSTMHPGGTQVAERLLKAHRLNVDVAFCPERIAEGRAMAELFSLPQIVAARTAVASTRAEKLFRTLTDQIVELTPEEAELAKLFINTWRYVKFATANQFWMVASDYGLDFERIRHAVTYQYPRAADLPGPGFAAGPCLLKDTMQLVSFSNSNFALGHSAMLVNEGLPQYLVTRLEARYHISAMTVGILGMAFKGGSDDPRNSLSYRLWKILLLRARATLCSDPYIADDRFVGMDELLDRADLVVVAAPHPHYYGLVTTKPVADVWGVTGRGVLI